MMILRIALVGVLLLEGLAFAKPPEADLSQDSHATVDADPMTELVVAAMKAPTTVAEAPAIVSVLDGKRMREHGYRRLGDAVGSLPGFLPNSYAYGAMSTPISRFMAFGSLVLLDGLDLYDALGFTLITETLPLDVVDRVEAVSGPGGVLWGANSFVGVLSVVTRTGETFQGIEAKAGYGHGVHSRHSFRAHLMAGGKVFGDKLKLFGYASFESMRDAGLPAEPYRLLVPNLVPGDTSFGPGAEAIGERAHRINLIANAIYGPLSLHVRVPFNVLIPPFDQTGLLALKRLPEDRIDCTIPANKDACAQRVDPLRNARDLVYRPEIRSAILRYRKRLAERVGVDARAFYSSLIFDWDPYILIPPSDLVHGGASVTQEFITHRLGAAIDVDVQLPWALSVLVGGEVLYDSLPKRNVTLVSDPSVPGLTGFRCIAQQGRQCTMPGNTAVDRLTGGVFASLQARMGTRARLSVGTRAQFYGGNRPLDPVLLLEAAGVWTLFHRINIKLQFAEGFRPPALLKTATVATGGQIAGNPDLRVERSRAAQGEINAGWHFTRGPLETLRLRADYAYTWVDDFIAIRNARFENTGEIGIHSLEFLARIQVRGGHHMSVGFTLNDGYSKEEGALRALPAAWLSLKGRFNLWRQRLIFATDATVLGPFSDPNQRPTVDGGLLRLGNVDSQGMPVGDQVTVARWSDRVLDPVGSSVIWNAALHFRLSQQVDLSLSGHNLLDVRSYYGESYMDLAALFEPVLSPWRGASFFFSLTLHS